MRRDRSFNRCSNSSAQYYFFVQVVQIRSKSKGEAISRELLESYKLNVVFW